MKCDFCEKEVSKVSYVYQKWGCRNCVPKMEYVPMYHLWEDGKGKYGVGWLNDVKRRKVVNGGEVVRDYGKRYFT